MDVSILEDETMRELHQVRAKIAREHDHDSQEVDSFYENLRFPGFTYGFPWRIFQTEEELNNYIDERNREFERRQALKVASDGMCPLDNATQRLPKLAAPESTLRSGASFLGSLSINSLACP